MKKRKPTLWQNLRWKFFLLKIRTWTKLNDLKYKLLRSKHCRKGFHYIESDGIKHTTYYGETKNKRPHFKERITSCNFFKCKFCDRLFFPTEKDRKNYYLIEGREFRAMTKFVKSISKFKKNGKKTKTR